MDFLSELLPIVLYFLGGVFLVVLIILFLKLSTTIDKVNLLLDDVLDKSSKLDGLFDSIENIGNSISSVNYRVTKSITRFIEKLFYKKKKKKEEEDDFYE